MIALVRNGVVTAVFENDKKDPTQDIFDWDAFAKGRGEVAVEVDHIAIGDTYPPAEA